MELFTYTPAEYTRVREMDLQDHFIKQTATFIAHKKQISFKEARQWTEWAMKTGRLRYDDPMVKLLSKDKERDRHRTKMRYSAFIEDIDNRDLIMTPTLTCYLPRKTLPSLLSKFTEERFYQRKASKKKGQKAKSYGDYETAKYMDVIQKKQKIDINSISGALSIQSTPFANRSGHSTLTSVCRIATAMANANTERFLQGRRHLWDYDSVVDNINTILTYMDLDKVSRVIEHHGLKLITCDELFESLKYSWDSYMQSPEAEKKIYAYLKTLTPLECTGYLYMGDFYHLCKYNDAWVRNHITDILGYRDVPPIPKEEVKQELAWVDEFFTPLLSMTLAHWIGTLSPFAPEHEDKDYYGYIGAYARYLKETMTKYQDYYQCFWRNEFIPAEAAMFPHVHRRAVLGGDTDSTLLTTYQWVDWYCGTLGEC